MESIVDVIRKRDGDLLEHKQNNYRINTTWKGVAINIVTASANKAQLIMNILSDCKIEFTVGLTNNPVNDDETIRKMLRDI